MGSRKGQPEDRQARLEKNKKRREEHAAKMAAEKPEDIQARLEKGRAKRAAEKPEDRQARLEKRREASAAKRKAQTRQEVENGILQQREKVRRHRREQSKLEKENYLQARKEKRWADDAKIRDVSKAPCLPFDSKTHIVTTECVKSVERAQEFDGRTRNDDGSYQANVCVVCDEIIKGVQPVFWLPESMLLSDDISNRLSVDRYETFRHIKLKDVLVKQYELPGLKGLLLSPRSKCNSDKERSCCKACYNSLMSNRSKAQSHCDDEENDDKPEGPGPPKKSIANGFLFGHLPRQFRIPMEDGSFETITVKEEDLTDILCAFLSPVRPYGYCFAYTGGAHKSLRGHFFFYETDLEAVGGAMEQFQRTGASPHVYAVLCGRMTPKQKEIARSRAKLDTKILTAILTWFIEESGHEGYEGLRVPAKCPEPTIVEEPESEHNTDTEKDAEKEAFSGSTFYFRGSNNPDPDNSVYKSNSDFVLAMINNTMPTLLVHGGEHANLRELKLRNACPLQFPFGLGDPSERRETAISTEEIMMHLCNVSLPQMMRGDFLLVLKHMHTRHLSFRQAVVSANSKHFGDTFGNKVARIDMDSLEQAATLADLGKKVGGIEGALLRNMKANTKCSGYSAEAAKYHRRIHFALCDYFGLPAIFLTITPCDMCTFRVRLFADAGSAHTLPHLSDDPFDPDEMEGCILDFELRKTQRMMYPGACSLVYQSLMEIVTECLLGWDSEKCVGTGGIFGVLEAWARTDEEQGRKTLHSHWILWVKHFNAIRDALHSEDLIQRKEARESFLKYVDKTICASYNNEFVVKHECTDGIVELPIADICTPASDNVCLPVKEAEVCRKKEAKDFRESRHKDGCCKLKGALMKCNKCNNLFTPEEAIRAACARLQQLSSGEGNASDALLGLGKKLPDKWLDIAAMRVPFDFKGGECTMDKEGKEGSWLNDKNIRSVLLHLRFDEHGYLHRGTCFKKGDECRAKLPMLVCNESYLFDKKHILDNTDMYKVVAVSEASSDRELREMKEVDWFHLDGERPVSKRSQFLVIPKRPQACQYLNPHNIHVSEVISCNTNVAIGDPSCVFYNTLYKTKNTQKEDTKGCKRAAVAIARRLLRVQGLQNSASTDNSDSNNDEDNNSNDDDEKDSSALIEGLGRIMTGTNAIMSQEICGAPLGHTLMCQKGSRFTYSHATDNLLLSQLEATEEKREVSCRVRKNKDVHTNKLELWPDSSANDYLMRSDDLENYCFYELLMDFEKCYNTYKEVDDMIKSHNEGCDDWKTKEIEAINPKKRHYPLDGHPGYFYSYLKRRTKIHIPVISMRDDALCDLKDLEIGNDAPPDNVIENRENFAKCAMMLFYPHRDRDLRDLKSQNGEGTFWEKFVEVGGLTPYKANDGKRLDSNELRAKGGLWERGKDIVHNIQARKTIQSKMSRPPDPLQRQTQTPEATGERAKMNVDDDDDDELAFDMDIAEFDVGLDGVNESEDGVLEPYSREQLRSSDGIIAQAAVSKHSISRFNLNSSSLTAVEPHDVASAKEDRTAEETVKRSHPRKDYKTIIKFIAGVLVGSEDDNEVEESNGSLFKELSSLEEWGKELDPKQFIAFKVLCCSFFLCLVIDGTDGDSKLGKMLSSSLRCDCVAERNALIRQLEKMGGNRQLVMFLTGPAGCGKSTSVELSQKYCHKFCQMVDLPFDDKTFYFTSTTGSSAALFGGMTIHSAAHLNKKYITEDLCIDWERIIILIIDELSFFKVSDMNELDRKLRRLTKRDVMYGGVCIVFSGDFHQLPPVKTKDVLYSCSEDASKWELSINCPVFLEKSHRFAGDVPWGEIMNRLRNGEETDEDREVINSHYVAPEDECNIPINASTACISNKERNAVEFSAWKRHLQENHPTVESSELPPDNVLFVECSIRQKKKRASQTIHDIVHSRVGDAGIKSTDFKCKGAKVAPVLRFYSGSQHMVNTNGELEEKHIGNGSLCICRRVKLKRTARRVWKNWDGHKVWTVSVRDVEYVEFEHFPKPPKGGDKIFRLQPAEVSSIVDLPLTNTAGGFSVKLGNLKVLQMPVNCNIATTGHKLQGMSLDNLVVNSWGYQFENWVYVVLSRVRTRGGLILNRKLDMKRRFKVPDKLLSFERRMKRREEDYLRRVHGFES